jgi:hypothetical protein
MSTFEKSWFIWDFLISEQQHPGNLWAQKKGFRRRGNFVARLTTFHIHLAWKNENKCFSLRVATYKWT